MEALQQLVGSTDQSSFKLWKLAIDEAKASIASARSILWAEKGLAVLRTKQDTLKRAADRYEEKWSTLSSVLLYSEVDLDPFYKEHLTLTTEIEDLQELLAESIDGKTATNHDSSISNTKVKLPEIKLPDFHGDIEHFPQFWELFTTLVDQRSDLNFAVKFTFLKNALKGSSAKLMSGFAITENNYIEAKALLLKTYQNDDKVSRKLIHQLMEIKPPKHEYKDLLEFQIKFEQILRSLRTYKDVDNADWFVMEMLLYKLSSETLAFLYQHNKSQYFSFKEFCSSFDVLINLLENSKVSGYKNTEHVDKVKKEEKKGSVMWQSVMKPHSNCIFCQQGHLSSRCPTFNTVELRRMELAKKGSCFRCGQRGHMANKCSNTSRCTACGGSHWIALCFKACGTQSSAVKKVTNHDLTPTYNKQNKDKNETKGSQAGNTHSKKSTDVSAENADTSTVTAKAASDKKGGVALPTAMLKVRSPQNKGNRNQIRCFFDSGSQRSFIHPKVVEEMGLVPTREETIHLAAFGGKVEPLKCPLVKLRLSLGKRVVTVPFLVTSKVEMELHIPGLTKTVNMLDNMGIKVADQVSDDILSDVTAVIGADQISKFICGTHKVAGVNLFSSAGGYIVYGSLPFGHDDHHILKQSVMVSRITVDELEVDTSHVKFRSEPDISKLWDLDVIGIKEEQYTPCELQALKSFADTIEYFDDQYWVRLPWKLEPEVLPTNYRVAIGQYRSLIKHLQRDPIKLEHYKRVIEEYLAQGFIEVVNDTGVKGHYLPHHPVLKDSTTTPLRIVFNASSKTSSEISLNDALMTGPSLTEKLIDSLLKFRVGKYALIADISKAFLRVGLQKIDRDYVRFLWSEDLSSDPTTYRFKSVLFGSTSSPFLLQATLYRHFENSSSPLRAELQTAFYVDNFSATVDEEAALYTLYTEATSCLAPANMPLQEWNSNSLKFNQYLGDEDRKEFPSVLGMHWDTTKDELCVAPVAIRVYSSLTKRQALSVCSGVYDPLGLLTPITVKAKLFMRDLWKLKVGWDDPLEVEIVNNFNKLVSEFAGLHCIKFPRAISTKFGESTLHVFCDASSQAYGAVAYICCNGISSILMSRSRVAPLKSRSIPQLELTAVLVGCRLTKYICTVLPCQFSIYVWTDNLPCLHWIQSNSSNIVYVKNRVGEILSLRESLKFTLCHIGTKENPADLLSRGTDLNSLSSSALWRCGPEWLNKENDWPDVKLKITMMEILTQDVPLEQPRSLFSVDRYSKLSKLLRVTNNVFKFLNIHFNNKFSHLDSSLYWLRQQQRTHYPLVYEALESQSTENKFQGSLKFISDLGLFLDDNKVIRSRGRLNESVSSYDMNHPKLLPPKSYLCRLIIEDVHSKNLHAGVSETLSQLRNEFWVPHGRQCVKKIVNSCVVCKYDVRKAFKYPGPPPLPPERVSFSRPFQHTGVDFTGAISLKDELGELTKFYVCLFTCAATRAVHLELIDSLSAESFILCLRRFVSRCSLPEKFISDNGTNFVATSKFLVSLQNDALVQDYLNGHKVLWQFISPRAPWQGGMYERMISIVKGALHKALHMKQVNSTELVTVLAEIEAVVNNRPLTYLDNDVNSVEALTPAHLLYGRKICLYPPYENFDVVEDFVNNTDILRQYNYKISSVINKFYKEWSECYLQSLREKHYSTQPFCHKSPAKGDVVIVNIDHPRQNWTLGRVVDVVVGSDGLIREVKVLSKGHISRKTVEKLIPLELDTELEVRDVETVTNSDEVEMPVEDIEGPSVRPKRRAADFARSLVKDLVERKLL